MDLNVSWTPAMYLIVQSILKKMYVIVKCFNPLMTNDYI